MSGLVLACALTVAPAWAATSLLRPDATVSNGTWTVDGGGGDAHEVVDDPEVDPDPPVTGSDELRSSGPGPVTAEVQVADPAALRTGETVLTVHLHAYVSTGAGGVLQVDLLTGPTVLTSIVRGPGTAAGWYRATAAGGLTQAELDDLRVRFVGDGDTAVHAAYVRVTTLPPAPSITGSPLTPGTTRSPSWAFAGPSGSTLDCRLERGATVLSDWTACASPDAHDLTGEPDGDYTFSVRAVDPDSATSSASSTYTLDTTAPAAPTIDSGPPAQSANPTAMWAFTGEGGALHSCRVDRADGTAVSDWGLCTSPVSYDLSGEPDGAYTFRVYSTDMAGNSGAESTHAFTLDRAAPAAPSITGAPPASGNGSAPAWSFTHEAGASAACRLERGATVVSAWGPCASPRSFDLSAEPEGAYTFRVRATDAAGNQGAEATGSYTLDRTAPAAPSITGGPTGASNDAAPQYSFTAEAGAAAECRLDRGATVVSDWASCSSPRSYALGAQPDGSYTFRVRATDAATNTGPEATRTYTLDRAAPAAPAITGGPPASSADAAPSFSFTHEAGATATCRMTRGATVVSDWAPCASPKGYDLAAEADGAYTFSVRATDAAGNTGTAATRNYTLDRVEPVAPTITGRPAAVSNDETPTWTFTASFDVVKYRCRLERGATVVSDYTVCTSPQTYDLSGQPDGTYTFKVRGSDDAANESTETSDTFTLDRAAPAAPAITGGPTGDSQNATPSYAFTAEAGAATACRVDRGGTVVSDWGPCVSPRSYDLTLQPDGAYTFRVRATDVAGNTGAEGTRTYTLDRTAPAAPAITSGPPADSNDDTPVYSFAAEAGTTFACRLERGATAVSDWAPCTTPAGYDLSGEVDASYTFRVRATDAAGNQGPEATRAYALDRQPPPAPSLTSTPGADTNDDTPSWGFAAAGGTATACRLERGATVVSDWSACASPRTYDLSAQPQGAYTFRVRATDAAGNTGADAAHTTTLDRTAPAAPAITGGPLLSTADPTPAFGFTHEAGAAAACRLERGATVVSDWSACSSPRGYDLGAEADGAYRFRVRATDAAGNTGADATRDFTLDRQAPSQPAITARPAASTNDETPSWTWGADADATDNCRITRGATVVVDWTICSSPRTFDLSAQPDGTYTFRVRSSDPAGNLSTEANDTFALDRQAPAAPSVVSGPAADSADETPSFGFAGEAGATFACRVERGATVVSDWAACASPRTYDLAAEPDGAYTFRVRATDAAGNTGPDGTRGYTLDRAAPAAPSITSGPAGDSPDGTPSYGWTAEAGAASECRVERGATVMSDWAACSSPRGYDLGAEPDGTYAFRVRATDAAGNTGPDASRTYTLDRIAPAAPSIASGPAADSTDDSPTYAFTAEAGAALACRLERGATAVSDWSACASPRTYDVGAEPDGTYTFRVRATDAAGNTGAEATHDYALDRTVPLTPALDARPGDDGSDRTPEWAFSTTEPGRTFECRLARGSTVLSDWGPCVSPRQFDLGLEPDGAYDFAVRAANAAGTRSAPQADRYRLDTMAPPAPVVSGGPAADSTDETPEWSVAAEPGATLTCRLERGAAVVGDWAPCTTPAGYDLGGEPDGTYTFRVRATDAAGNAGPDASSSYTLDRTVPPQPAIGTTPGAAGSDPTPTWTFSGAPGTTFECRLARGATTVSDWAACTSPHTPDLTGEADGTYVLEVRAVNPAGTRGPSASDEYDLDRAVPAAPVITGGPAADSPDDTPSWSFTGEPGASFACRVERGATAVRDWAACTDPETADLTAEPDAAYTFRVRQTDAAGNTSPDASRSYTLDRTVPAAPAIATRPASPSPDHAPAWTLTGTSGYTLECRLTRATGIVYDWAACGSSHTYDLSAEPDGSYALHARQVNTAGTRGPEVTDAYVLDATPPSAPDITASPGPVGSGSEPAWSFAAEPGAAVECRLQRGGVDVRPWAPCTSPRTFGLAGEPDGDYTFSVRATDAAGNTGPAASDDHRVDRVPPAPPAIASAPGPLGQTRAPSWSFTAEAGATFECTLERGDAPLAPWALCASPRGYDLAGEPDGDFAFGVRARDEAGNTSPATRSAYVLDTTPGAVTIDGGPGPLGRDRRPAWQFSGEAAATFECRLSLRDLPVDDWSACTSPYGFDLAGRPDGPFAFMLRAIDPAGNVGPAGSAEYVLDTTPPAAPSIDGRPDSPGEDRTPSWRFSGEADATFDCRVEGASAATVIDWTLCASPFSADLAGVEEGRYRFLVRATDLAGNAGEPAAGSYELVMPAPAPPPHRDEPASDPPRKDPPPADPSPPAPDEPRAAGPLTATPRPAKPKPEPEPEPEPAAKPRERRPRERPALPDPRRRAEPRAAARSTPARPEARDSGGNFATRAVAQAVETIAEHPDKSVFPLSLLMLVLAFLAIQNRIDRSDPKLALAPTFADPDLEFRPPPGDTT
ncbi:MAG TPA: Ig-like domain repeat protein [Solirubrobacteraceae bacterium]|nr:Ig-like domain repeat protein [Solirubrobacteraceae bacterium]